MTTVTLIGYLGKDRQILDTRERSYTAMRYNDLAGRKVETEIPIPSQEYARLSLATHQWERGRQVTRWHRLVAWDVNRPEFRGVRLARKGDRVEITGRVEAFSTASSEGEPREMPQIVIESFRLVQVKPRREWP